MSTRILDEVSTSTQGAGTDGCLQKEFTRSNIESSFLLPHPASWKDQNSTKCKSGISWHSKSTLIMTRMKDGDFLQMQSRRALFQLSPASEKLWRCHKCNHLRVFMQVAVYQSIITSINSFSVVFPSIGTSLKVRSNQDRLIGTRKFSVWRWYD